MVAKKFLLILLKKSWMDQVKFYFKKRKGDVIQAIDSRVAFIIKDILQEAAVRGTAKKVSSLEGTTLQERQAPQMMQKVLGLLDLMILLLRVFGLVSINLGVLGIMNMGQLQLFPYG